MGGASVTDEYRQRSFAVNVTGTQNLVHAAQAAGVKRFVYTASSSCYGIPDSYPTPETAAVTVEPNETSDVEFTYQLMVHPKTPSPYKDDFEEVESVEAVDPYTVRVRYKHAFAKAINAVATLP